LLMVYDVHLHLVDLNTCGILAVVYRDPENLLQPPAAQHRHGGQEESETHFRI